jgi:hypothetical protein
LLLFFPAVRGLTLKTNDLGRQLKCAIDAPTVVCFGSESFLRWENREGSDGFFLLKAQKSEFLEP